MDAKAPAFSIFRFQELDSTNNYVREHLDELDNLSVVTAYCQTAGRGQRGNRWLSAPGENLTFTLLLKFAPGALEATRQMRLTALATVALKETLLDSAPGLRLRIKWPNDLYARNRKLCGMLIENTLEGPWIRTSAIGIGLNVNQTEFDPSLMNPTSLRRLLPGAGAFDTEALLGRFLERIAAWLPELGGATLWARYKEELYRKGERHDWTENATGQQLSGVLEDVREDGRMALRLDDGSLRLFSFKEISYII